MQRHSSLARLFYIYKIIYCCETKVFEMATVDSMMCAIIVSSFKAAYFLIVLSAPKENPKTELSSKIDLKLDTFNLRYK